jgi:hypothetical protein
MVGLCQKIIAYVKSYETINCKTKVLVEGNHWNTRFQLYGKIMKLNHHQMLKDKIGKKDQ